MSLSKNSNGCVLIPAYNEERGIAAAVRAALDYLPVLVIDDGSSDQTVQQAQLAGAAVLSNLRNMGKGAALRAGMRQALAQGCDFVITLDGDGQHDPQEIPAFLHAYTARQADLIIGQRDFSQMPLVRRVSNTLGTLLFSWAVGRRIPDNQSGYRLISRPLLEVLHESAEPGFEFEVEMIVLCRLHGLNMEWVPIRTIYGEEKSHIQPLKHLVKFIQVALRARSMIQNSIA